MSQITENKLQTIQQQGYELDFSITFSMAFENFKKIALVVGAIILVLIILFSILIGGVAGVFIGVGDYTELLTGLNPAAPSTVLILTSYISTIIMTAFFIAPLTAGILKIAHLAENNEEFGFSNVFDYYKSVYFKEIFVASIIIASINGGIKTLFDLYNSSYGEFSDDFVLSFFALIINVLLSVFVVFTIPSIIFGELKAIPAIKASFLLVRKNFLMIIVLLLIGIVFAMLGIIGLCIGIFFTLPFYYSLQYIIYRTALPIDEIDEIDEIGNSEY